MSTSISTDPAEPGGMRTSAGGRQAPAPIVEWSTSRGEFVPIPARLRATEPVETRPAESADAQADGGSTPMTTTAMAKLTLHEKSRYRAAAYHARRIYPGPLGELVHREFSAYAEFGYRMAIDGLIPRLAAEILATPAWPFTSPVRGTALAPAARQSRSSSRSTWPPRRIGQ